MNNNSSKAIRQTFIDYFKKNNHVHVPSSSLIPENDPTLLFANAGMNQFKNTFLGVEKRDYSRAVTAQKCVRAGGKHNDLENVGFTARHHTFFEMLGNFSFGDYFKKDAIHYAWELLTKELGIPKDKLYVTVFETDDEAADIWHKQEGVPRDRIFRLGEKDNFWRMGDVGPCGPCSEIFYDHGPHAGKESDPYKGILAGEDRFVEIWNLVFMQYDEKSPGQLVPLPKPSVDTGSGLERVVAAMQGRYNNYNTDLFTAPIQKVCDRLGWSIEEMIALELEARKTYGSLNDGHNKMKSYRSDFKDVPVTLLKNDLAALRVLADHCRSTSFLIADGALPSNEGRGYVLRRIMRRALRYGFKLKESESFLPVMSETLIELMGDVYPELLQRKAHIMTTIKDEEKRFISTLSQGTDILNQEIKKLSASQKNKISGELVFKLYDTYGFPMDLTQLMAEEQGFTLDEQGFQEQMQASKAKSKSSWKSKAMPADEQLMIQLSQDVKKSHNHIDTQTHYVGQIGAGTDILPEEFGKKSFQSKVIGLATTKEVASQLKSENEYGFLITEQTPFYAESGGQAGDMGEVIVEVNGQKKFAADVLNCTKNNDLHIHHIKILSGEVKIGDKVELKIDVANRRNTMSNHSATHLMHTALRQVLGTHITQAGSLVDAEKTRFDFTHNKPLSSDEIYKIENLVNQEISKSRPVRAELKSHKQAIADGAIALFGEKYGDTVRVLTMGDFSCELCGGTHVSNTSQIQMFKIISESGVSSGVRRIEAITGERAVSYARASMELLKSQLGLFHMDFSFDPSVEDEQKLGLDKVGFSLTAENVKFETQKVESKLNKLKDSIKDLEKELKKIKSSQIDVDAIIAEKSTAYAVNGQSGRLVVAQVDIEDRELLAQIADQMKSKIQTGVVVLFGSHQNETNSYPTLISVSKNLSPQVNAGQLLKTISAKLGGKGGGRPDFAQGAVNQIGKLEDIAAWMS